MTADESRQILTEIIRDSDYLIEETRRNRRELREISAELEKLYASDQIMQLAYDIKVEQIRRSHEHVNDSIKKLERQKKIAIMKLRELNQDAA